MSAAWLTHSPLAVLGSARAGLWPVSRGATQAAMQRTAAAAMTRRLMRSESIRTTPRRDQSPASAVRPRSSVSGADSTLHAGPRVPYDRGLRRSAQTEGDDVRRDARVRQLHCPVQPAARD